MKNTAENGLLGCTADNTKNLPGCNDPLVQKAAKLKSLLQDATGANASTLLAGIGNYESSLLYSVAACAKADTSSGMYLQYQHKNPNQQGVTLDSCIQNFNISDSTVTGTSFAANCNGSGDSGGDLPPPDQPDNTALIAGIGGGSALVSSMSCCCLIILAIVASR